MSAMTATARPAGRTLAAAARGALIGALVCGGWLAAFPLADVLMPLTSDAQRNEMSLGRGIALGLIGTLLVPLVAARPLGLRRPWAVAVAGASIALPLGYGAALGVDSPLAYGVLPLVVVLSYAGAACCGLRRP